MVIHEEGDGPVEENIIKTAQTEPKKYIIVKNHVRELSVNGLKDSSVHEKSPEIQKHDNIKTKKSLKKRKKQVDSISLSESDYNTDSNATEISKRDLEELKMVYKKCKEVMTKIETKYGHLLDLDSEVGPSRQRKRQTNDSDVECYCSVNKKIIFDDNGQELVTESVLENHVCPKKLKRRHSTTYVDTKNVQIEYEDTTALPDDLQSLTIILQDSDIRKTFRNKVINKIRTIRQGHMNEIRFDRHSMIEKLKSGPNELFDFNGSNLASLSGYPTWK